MEAGCLEIVLRAKSPVLFSRLKRISLSLKSKGDSPESRHGSANIGPHAPWYDKGANKLVSHVQEAVANVPTALVVSSKCFILEVLCEVRAKMRISFFSTLVSGMQESNIEEIFASRENCEHYVASQHDNDICYHQISFACLSINYPYYSLHYV